MQMVRTITGFKNKTIYRKIYEMILAYIINFRYSKKQIIDCYLRNAFLGSHIYGVNKAISLVYHKTELDELKDYECSFIASMLLFPRPSHENIDWIIKIIKRSIYAKTVLSSIKNKLYVF